MRSRFSGKGMLSLKIIGMSPPHSGGASIVSTFGYPQKSV
jgi:hypothetical protein